MDRLGWAGLVRTEKWKHRQSVDRDVQQIARFRASFVCRVPDGGGLIIWKPSVLEADWAWSRAQSSLRGQKLHAVVNATVIYEIVGRGQGMSRVGFVRLDDGDNR